MKCVSPGMPAIAIVHHAQENLWASRPTSEPHSLLRGGMSRQVRSGMASRQGRRGRDTYLVLVTREPLADPFVLQEVGVRSGPRGPNASPLGDLVRSINATRGAQPLTPVSWSISRLPLRPEPAEDRNERRN